LMCFCVSISVNHFRFIFFGGGRGRWWVHSMAVLHSTRFGTALKSKSIYFDSWTNVEHGRVAEQVLHLIRWKIGAFNYNENVNEHLTKWPDCVAWLFAGVTNDIYLFSDFCQIFWRKIFFFLKNQRYDHFCPP
jgi:hypothetical protein